MNREFLQQYPLYRKFKTDLPHRFSNVDKPAIHMHCPLCASAQTFNMNNDYAMKPDYPTAGAVARAVYICTSCNKFLRHFFLKFDLQGKYVMKVGQQPAWEITCDAVLAKALGSREGYYKKGLICESQGYGIGAFVYYRRVVEEIIDELLTDISDLISSDDHARYLDALDQVRKTTITQEKIDLVKDLLPPILRPQGMNPLSALHSVLSEGLHSESDERCVELAMTFREVLVFLVNQVAVTKTAGASFTDGMRKLLERRKT